MKSFIALFLIYYFLISYLPFPVSAENINNYSLFMDKWLMNKQIADKYLHIAEKYLKEGNRSDACNNQKLASEYGIVSFKYLKLASNEVDFNYKIDNLDNILNKWKSLSNCNIN